MRKTKVVDLGAVRNLLAEWDRVRAHILAGDIDGFYAAFRDSSGQETIFLGGVFQNNPGAALKAAMRVSVARTRIEDAVLPTKRRVK